MQSLGYEIGVEGLLPYSALLQMVGLVIYSIILITSVWSCANSEEASVTKSSGSLEGTGYCCGMIR